MKRHTAWLLVVNIAPPPLELMWTLDQKTDINAGLLDRFRQKLRLIEEANLSDVEISDEVLDMFGFFL